MYIKRYLEEQILKASNQFSVVMLTGARQTGKSTMLMRIKEKERAYVSLRDRRNRMLAENDPTLFFQTFGDCLLIDEFQEVPSLLDEMLVIIEKRSFPGSNTGACSG